MSRIAALLLLAFSTNASALELTERLIRLDRELTIPHAAKVAEELFKLDAAGREPIVLVVATRSGFVPAAMVLVDAIGAVESPVFALIQPEAFGVGALVAAFCDKRYAFPNSAVLVSKLEYEAEKVMKDSPPLPAAAAETYVARIYELYAKRLGLKPAELRTRAEAGWFLTAEDAKAAGFVTDVVDRVAWTELVVETVEVKRTATVKAKRPALDAKDPLEGTK